MRLKALDILQPSPPATQGPRSKVLAIRSWVWRRKGSSLALLSITRIPCPAEVLTSSSGEPRRQSSTLSLMAVAVKIKARGIA